MTKIGIISGGGDLPLIIGNNLIKKNFNVFFFIIKNHTDIEKYKNLNFIQIELNSLNNILTVLNSNKIEKIIMIGSVKRPSAKDIKFDINTLTLFKNYLMETKGDDQLLKSISKIFLKNGYPLFDWKIECKDLFVSQDNLTTILPSVKAIKNKEKGLNIFKMIGHADIGQSLILQNQLVLGIECLEGTDDLIIRCNSYKKLGDKGILLKLSKYKQHNDLDLPTVGIDTFVNLKKYNFEGAFIEKNKCILVDKEIVVDYCNSNNLFLSTVNKID